MIGREDRNGPQGDGINEEVAFTLNTSDRHAVCFVQNQRDEVRLMGGDGQIAGAVTAAQFTKGQNFVATMHQNASGDVHVAEDMCGTLTATSSVSRQQIVCISNDAEPTVSDQAPTLKASHDGVPRVVCIADGTANAAIEDGMCGTLTAHASHEAPIVCFHSGNKNDVAYIGDGQVELSPTLRASGSGTATPVIVLPESWCDAPAFSKRPGQQIATRNDGLSYALTRSGIPRVQMQAGVRRLMPVECERLQGFPDRWTQLGETSDSPRYKALGNSMAVPVIRWLGERIELVDSLQG